MKYIFWTLWRIWFYVLVALLTLILSPLLIILLLRESWYPALYFLGRNFWATPILYGMGFFPSITTEQKLQKGNSYMLIANHTSMMDIMLMLYISKRPFVFVGKKELGDIPLFGYFYKRIAILVDRSNLESRKAVYIAAKKRLDKGLSICIFPEGGVPDESIILDNFKDGAFRLAIDYQIPIVPIIFSDCKKRFPFRFFAGSMGKMRAHIFPFVETKEMTQDDRNYLKQNVYYFMLTKLSSQK